MRALSPQQRSRQALARSCAPTMRNAFRAPRAPYSLSSPMTHRTVQLQLRISCTSAFCPRRGSCCSTVFTPQACKVGGARTSQNFGPHHKSRRARTCESEARLKEMLYASMPERLSSEPLLATLRGCKRTPCLFAS